MSLQGFVNEKRAKDIDDIINDENLTTMTKLHAIVGNNFFTNANRAKGILKLIKENATEINTNPYIASVFAKSIQDNCLQDFQRLMQNANMQLPSAVQDALDKQAHTTDEIDR